MPGEHRGEAYTPNAGTGMYRLVRSEAGQRSVAARTARLTKKYRQRPMLHTLAVSNYRSLRDFIAPLGELTLITGPNGSGKSNVYRALRLLAEAGRGGPVSSPAREGA